MGDVGDFWKDVSPVMKKQSKDKRKQNREWSSRQLEMLGIEFESKNDGAHLIVKGRDCLIDFWPGTGKYITRNGAKSRGVINVIKLCVKR